MGKFKKACLSRETGKAEVSALLIYVIGLIVISCFHEPWFDEAQAWLIAKSCSVKELLTYIGHYEGHPPLWYFVLAPFAKLGAPYELSLKAINITFCTAAMALLIFKAPFYRIVRCLLPFNFFFFYQYGIVNRPYSMMMLAFMLMAITYKDRNAHPWKYILSLSFLCLTSAYGVLIAGGLCVVWTGEIIIELRKKEAKSKFYKDNRFLPLLSILILAVLIIISIIPADDIYYTGIDKTKEASDILVHLLLFTILPYESWSGMLVDFSGEYLNLPLTVASIFASVICWILLISITAKSKKFFTFIIPYLLFDLFLAFKYGAPYHMGISTLFHIFIFWIIADSPEGIKLPERLIKFVSMIKTPLLKRISSTVACIIALMPIVYSIVASFNDIKYSYAPYHYVELIKDNDLEGKKIMTDWNKKTIPQYYVELFKELFTNTNDASVSTDKKDESQNNEVETENDANDFPYSIPCDHDKIIENRTYITAIPVAVLPYFNENIIMNHNPASPDDLYMHYKYKEDEEENFSLVRTQGLPDFIIHSAAIEEIYSEEELEGVRYVLIDDFRVDRIYKINSEEDIFCFYIREDLLDEYPQFVSVYDRHYNDRKYKSKDYDK